MDSRINMVEYACTSSHFVNEFICRDNIMSVEEIEQLRRESVKCVLVGDTASGKTRLICARACDKKFTISQLIAPHVPTVWAIDQYRIHNDVLKRSCLKVDGVDVSLRLWDTFGDHTRDRRFAYGRADVVLMCFSIGNRASLRNCLSVWYLEIRKNCPATTPVLLIGCKSDLRYMYSHKEYLTYFNDRNISSIRPVRKCELVMPDEGRRTANELNIPYFETSAMDYHGVHLAFDNAIRAALICRRNNRFWITNLKKVRSPTLQIPYCPPEPALPFVKIEPSTFSDDLTSLYEDDVLTDATIVVGLTKFKVHQIVLAAASSAFFEILTRYGKKESQEILEGKIQLSNEECNKRKLPFGGLFESNDQKNKRNSVELSSKEHQEDEERIYYKELNTKAFKFIKLEKKMSSESKIWNTKVEIQMCDKISPKSMKQFLKFLYTYTIDKHTEIEDLLEVANLLDCVELVDYITNELTDRCDFIKLEIQYKFKQKFRYRISQLFDDINFMNITFELDDGSMSTNRAILSARCDVIRAMLNSDFKEKNASVIRLPEVDFETFTHLLMYLFKDELPTGGLKLTPMKAINLIEIGNRLCLTRFVNIMEKIVVDNLYLLSKHNTEDAIKYCLELLDGCKLYNAYTLFEWCINYLCINYNFICQKYPKLVKNLSQEDIEYLTENRWPPVWYLKEYDYYVKQTGCSDRTTIGCRRASKNWSCFNNPSSLSPDNEIVLTRSPLTKI